MAMDPDTMFKPVDADVKHVAGPPELYGTRFRSACRCGYPGKECITPSHAYSSTAVHAETALRREAGGGLPQAPTGRPATSTDRAPRVRSGGTGGPCGCGCGETCGGRFRPGHDSKLLSRLQSEVKSGAKTAADALAELADHPKLQVKLSGRLG